MQAHELTVKQLFSGHTKFVSPSFQRPYNWVSGACERIITGIKKDHASLRFQGAIVAMDLSTNAETGTKHLLVDGNHRLITLLVILLAVRDALAAHDPDTANAINLACFQNIDEEGNRHFKSIVPQKDRSTFEFLVTEKGAPAPSSPLLRTYKFASTVIGNDSPGELHVYRERLMEKFTFVLLSLERDEDPYPIFKLLSTPGEDFTRRGLREYTRFSPNPELMALIAGGESQDVEFKERAINSDKHDMSGSTAITRSVAGFMNSFTGGTLLIGIRDDGSVRGINTDYPLVDKGKNNWDGFSLFLNNTLRSRLDTENAFLFYTITRCQVMNRDVCMVRVKPATAPVYLDKHLFVRNGSQTIEMQGPDLVDYVATRWPGNFN